jgi:hypothetical protein
MALIVSIVLFSCLEFCEEEVCLQSSPRQRATMANIILVNYRNSPQSLGGAFVVGPAEIMDNEIKALINLHYKEGYRRSTT